MTYVISDLHGRCDKYQTLLKTLPLRDEDTLYVLGDILDRGPDGVRILLDMMEHPNIIPILGNHEFTAAICLPWLLKEVTSASLDDVGEEQFAALSEWIINGGGPTLRSLNAISMEQREDILDYIREMSLYAEVEAGGRSFLLVHAALTHPDRPLESRELEDFLFGRPRPDDQDSSSRYMVFGHTPTRLLRQEAGQPPEDTIFFSGKRIAIDCGCVFGGKLGCLCLETLEAVYV